MSFTIGFIGCGNMAEGIIRGISSSNIEYNSLNVFDIDKDKLDKFSDINKCVKHNDAVSLVNASDIVFLCIKPNCLDEAMKGIICENKAFVSILAGIKLNDISLAVDSSDSRYMRVMPNMPIKVGEGAICIADNYTLNKKEYGYVLDLFSSIGKVFIISEDLMDSVTAISGSGPAYVFYIIDAMTKAGEEIGLDHETSLMLSIQTFKGSLDMINRDSDLELLCDSICSKGGTTIEAVNTFDEYDMKDIFKKAIKACRDKSILLSRKDK